MSNTNQSRRSRQSNNNRPSRNPPPPEHPHDLPNGDNGNQENNKRRKPISVLADVNFIENKKWTRGEIMTVIALIISTGMAYATYRLFEQTITQTKAATDSAKAAKISADAAKRSADLQKQALDSQIAAKKQSDIADAKKLGRDTLFINKQKAGIDAQIASIKVNQDNFNAINKAMLQAGNFSITYTKDTVVVVTFALADIGGQPAKAIQDYILVIDTVQNITDTAKIIQHAKQIWQNDNTYITIYAPQPKTSEINGGKLNSMGVDALTKGKNSVYVYGKIRYINTATDKKGIYTFMVEVNLKNGNNYRFMKNDNASIK